jgi:dienelactone hydrolase
MAGALSRAGVENELITIRGGPHGFDGNLDDSQAQAAFKRVLAFLQEHLT